MTDYFTDNNAWYIKTPIEETKHSTYLAGFYITDEAMEDFMMNIRTKEENAKSYKARYRMGEGFISSRGIYGTCSNKPEGATIDYNVIGQMLDKQEVQRMNTLERKIEKYVVMTTCGIMHSSYETEKEALDYCKRCLRDKCDKRFLILVVSKEVGQKSPEIEIEEVK